MKEFLMPSLGADMEDGVLVEWRKSPGDPLKKGDIIADVDTQKGLIEIEVFDDGILDKWLVKEGVKVPVDTPLALIRSAEEAPSDSDSIRKVPDVAPSVEEKAISPKRIKITPLAKTIAQKHQIDYSSIKGSGPEGAIVKADIEKLISKFQQKEKIEKTAETPKEPEQVLEEQPTVSPSPAPAVESIRAAVAAAMSRSNRDIPHYYLEKQIDMSLALEWLKEKNKQLPIQQRLLPVVLFIKAVAKALDDVPSLNAIWENGLQIKNEINIGFVVSLRAGGVMIPTIHQVDMKSLPEIMASINDLIIRSRAFKLRSSELSESTITITSLGENSSEKVFGVIYPPQVAIIGFGEITDRPVAVNGMLAIRPMVTVTVAGDHRATDGLVGSRFLASLNKHLQKPDDL